MWGRDSEFEEDVLLGFWRVLVGGCVCVIVIAVLATPCSMQDLSSLTRDRTHAPCSGNMGS